ncbi:MAG: hypothetical protein JJ900_00390 [Rhodospirillales bacterium]|nr:hypothetical protein [Rhodospirillales bacterium]MBO6785274.1 hypothetical protein [Rhodospirillales bacterium]
MKQFEMSKAGEYWKLFISGFNFRRHMGRIQDLDSLKEFIVTRSAFIAQKTLYGYVKTRMGTKYPEMFQDQNIIHSLNIAKMHAFDACLSDFCIWAIATAFSRMEMDDSGRAQIALSIFKHGIHENLEESVDEFNPDDAVRAFEDRLASVDWHGAAQTRDQFTLSPTRVVKWAPISDDLKKYDIEYVENSVKFAWANIRRQFEKRLDRDALAQNMGGPAAGVVAEGTPG